MELMSSMMQKISLLEQKIDKQAQEIQLKDRKIAELEEKMKTLQKGEDGPESSAAEDLETRCLQLQTQVWEMERFLNDYGLIWVGDRHEELEDLESLRDDELLAKRFWKPGEAVVSKHQVDFDLILENVKSLNMLAGDGVSHVEHTPGGARLRQPEPLPLTLYQNGIVMLDGPFRSYEEQSAQQCLQDIMDGYFPSELQARYPDGVPLQVTDRRDVVFQERDLPGSFPGHGQVVGHSKLSRVEEPTEIPGPTPSLEQFWNKYSTSSMHSEAMATQDTVGAMQQVWMCPNNNPRSRLAWFLRLSALHATIPPPSNLFPNCSIRAHTQHFGTCSWSVLALVCLCVEQVVILTWVWLQGSEGVRSSKEIVVGTPGLPALQRGGDSDSYEIISTFPQRVYADNSRSLQECGLIPSASLLLRRRDPFPPEGTGLQTA
uniref:UBX domain-containing protein 11 n=1 Tax=Meleagris gallopavo TaxID=9103 RepID=G1MPU6_MELGA